MVHWGKVADDVKHGRFEVLGQRAKGFARGRMAQHRARRGLQLTQIVMDEAIVGSPSLPPGILIDAGAHYGAVTTHYAERGWRVLAVEPDAVNRKVLVAAVNDLAEVTIDPRAIAPASGEQLPLYRSETSSGITSLSAFHTSHFKAEVVTTVTLADLMFEHQLDHVDVLKTDLEGHDLPALQSYAWGSVAAPSVVVCEYEDRKTLPLGYTLSDTEAFLLGQGYSVAISEWWPIVEYGQFHRWRRLAASSADVDPESWGNIVAWQPGAEAAFRALEEQARAYPSAVKCPPRAGG